jgi:hypothetical protein
MLIAPSTPREYVHMFKADQIEMYDFLSGIEKAQDGDMRRPLFNRESPTWTLFIRVCPASDGHLMPLLARWHPRSCQLVRKETETEIETIENESWLGWAVSAFFD